MSTAGDKNVGVGPTDLPRRGHEPTVAALSASSTDAATRFTDLFHEHWSAVFSYALRRTATASDAHDVAADAFTVAWRRFDDLPADHVLPWLYRTAANVLANSARSDRRRTRLDVRLAAQPRSVDRPLDETVAEDHALFEAFATLNEDQQELLALVAWEGLDHDDIASVLDISTGAVASRLSRARSRFEEALAAADEGAGHEEGDGTRRHP